MKKTLLSCSLTRRVGAGFLALMVLLVPLPLSAEDDPTEDEKATALAAGTTVPWDRRFIFTDTADLRVSFGSYVSVRERVKRNLCRLESDLLPLKTQNVDLGTGMSWGNVLEAAGIKEWKNPLRVIKHDTILQSPRRTEKKERDEARANFLKIQINPGDLVLILSRS